MPLASVVYIFIEISPRKPDQRQGPTVRSTVQTQS